MAADNKFPKDEISELISKGRRQGFLLYEDIDKTFQTTRTTAAISTTSFLPSTTTESRSSCKGAASWCPGGGKTRSSPPELERTTDPVKLYLREMGNISLLTREGEIAIAGNRARGKGHRQGHPRPASSSTRSWPSRKRSRSIR